MKKHNNKSGFTLVELAIVLVIIGLIVGGVLAGQDLIKAAEQRAAIGQIEKMDTVTNAFRGKYNGLPGDLSGATNFGFEARPTTTTNGDGKIDATTAGRLSNEAALFFADLADASLITENLTGVTTAEATEGGVSTTMSDTVPLSKFGKGIFIWTNSNQGSNYYMMDNATVASTGALTGGYTALTRMMAFNVDSKLDDGSPITGKVMAVDDVTGATATTHGNLAADDCVDTDLTPDNYSLAPAGNGDEGKCALRIRASF